jgi:uncharacterized protein (TIGR02284 family)
MTDPATLVSDASNLQEILTRYRDSHDGYLQAAELVALPELAAAFRDIATRRAVISEQVATLIEQDGFKPDLEGSNEAGIHRWWLRLRDKMSDQDRDANAILSECIRGETELARTLQGALESESILPSHVPIVTSALDEVKMAVRSFDALVTA